MTDIRIGFRNFCIFVHHKDGLAVLPGSTGHNLYLVDGRGKEHKVSGDVHLSAIKDGQQVPGGPTREADGQWMPDLAWMFNRRPYAIPYERVFGAARGCQHSRVYLHGGALQDLPAETPDMSREMALLQWDFSSLGALPPSFHRITNVAEFSCPAELDTSYALIMNRKVLAELRPGEPVIFANQDAAACPDIKDVHLEDKEMGALLNALGLIIENYPVADPTELARILRARGNGETCKPCGHVSVNPVLI